MLNSDETHIHRDYFNKLQSTLYYILTCWLGFWDFSSMSDIKHFWNNYFSCSWQYVFFQINLFKNLKNNDSKFQHLKIYFSCHRFLSITQLNETEKKHHPSIINFSCFYKYSFSSSLFSQLSSHRYQLVTAPILTVMIGVLL